MRWGKLITMAAEWRRGYARFEAYRFNSIRDGRLQHDFWLSAVTPSRVLSSCRIAVAARSRRWPVGRADRPERFVPEAPDITLPQRRSIRPGHRSRHEHSGRNGRRSQGVAGAGAKPPPKSCPDGHRSASTATAKVTLPASMLSVLYAAATINLRPRQRARAEAGKGACRPLMINGEKVTRIRWPPPSAATSHDATSPSQEGSPLYSWAGS